MPAFGPEELRERSRDLYVGNETDTDQYRETQPTAGVAAAADLLQRLEAAGDDVRYIEAVELLHAWLGERLGQGMYGYDGAESLAPLLSLRHDVMWDAGEHPYYGTLAELTEFLEDN